MLRPLLGVGEQLLLQALILRFTGPPVPGPGNRSQRGADPPLDRLGLHHHLGARADQVPAPEIEERHVRRGVHHPQAAVDLEGIPPHLGFEPLADHQLEHVAGGDVLPGRGNGRLVIGLAAVAPGDQLLKGFRRPLQRFHPARQGPLHALLQLADAGFGPGVGVLRVGAVAEIGIGHGGELAFHLVEHQQAVRQHPAAFRRSTGIIGVDGHGGLDPADQFIAPETEQLPHRRQPRHRCRTKALQALGQQLERVAAMLRPPPIPPALQGPLPPNREGPERVGHHKAPAPQPLAPSTDSSSTPWRLLAPTFSQVVRGVSRSAGQRFQTGMKVLPAATSSAKPA